MDTVYIETSIVSYLRRQTSSLIVAAARQVLTRHWWDNERSKFELVTSQYVVDEASVGDSQLVAERLQLLDSIPLLPNAPEIPHIANQIMMLGVLPENAKVDALHIATVAHHRIQYLLTWNCKHIANARSLYRIHRLFDKIGIPIPIVCTPEELLNNDLPAD